MRHSRTHFGFASVALVVSVTASAQTPPAAKPQPDRLVLKDGETLLGHFTGSSGGAVNFHSDVLGDLSPAWTNVTELHASGRYAVIEKGVSIARIQASRVPIGTIQMANQMITVNPGGGAAARVLKVGDAARIFEEKEFQDALHPDHGIAKDWKGTVTAGASLVEATQQSRTFTGAVALTRAIPVEGDLPPRNRTSVDLSASDGFLVQPGTPRLRTEIFHGDAERDEYFSGSRIFGFGQVALDHNFSQGLQLQQDYGAGIGWTVSKSDSQSLDLKGNMSYLQQRFDDVTLNQKLAASTFSENYMRKFAHGITVSEGLSVTPTWNNLHAWLASANAALTIPVYGRLAFSITSSDSFLNNPSPGFKKNSFQLTTGLTLTVK